MKAFVDSSNQSFSFSSCNTCQAQCCDGRHSTIYSQLLLEDFKTVSKHFPIVFTFGEMGYLKANVLFTKGDDFCPYIKDLKCTIYDERPSICRNYPLSPNLDNKIYIDTNCPAVTQNKYDSQLIKEGVLQNKQNYPTLQNYQEKFVDTHLYLEQFNKKEDFENIITINGIKFYKFTGNSDDIYMQLHQNSIKQFFHF